MRIALVLLLCAGAALPAPASAQESPSAGGELDDAEGYAALSADDLAQLTLGGFRRYLERIRTTDAALYAELDPPTAAVEDQDRAADAVFWAATGLSAAALIAAIPIHTELGDSGSDVALALLVGGVSTFVLGAIIQAIVRPGHSELVRLIDRHDELVGRR